MQEVRHLLVKEGLVSGVLASTGSTLSTPEGIFFVKIGTGGSFAKENALEYEAMGLTHLANTAKTLRVPRPLKTGKLANGCGFIVMDYIELSGETGGKHNTIFSVSQEASVQHKLGTGLAELHKTEVQQKVRKPSFSVQLISLSFLDFPWMVFVEPVLSTTTSLVEK